MSRTCRCGNGIGRKRWELGFRICTACGEARAQTEIKAKQERVLPSHNKGTLVYAGSGNTFRKNLVDMAAKNPRDQFSPSTPFIAAEYVTHRQLPRARYTYKIERYERDEKGKRLVVWRKVPDNEEATKELANGGQEFFKLESRR